MVSHPDPDEIRRKLRALATQTSRLPDLDMEISSDRVEQYSVLYLLEDRAALGRRCGFSDEEIGELAGVSPGLVADVLSR